MKLLSILTLTAAAITPALAQETRQHDAHEHGVGQLNIAFDGNSVAMELHAPGADIVGFEYEAESDDDHAKIDAAIAVLSEPLTLFRLPEAAGCDVVFALAKLEGGHDDHDDHGDHDDHDDHEDHDDHDEHDDHDDHEEGAGHTEFHAEYLVNCADMAAVNSISFAYFDAFPNALEVEVQMISDSGANAFEVERDAPILDLAGQ